MTLKLVLVASLVGYALTQRPESSLQNRLNLRKTFRSQYTASDDIDTALLYPAYNLSVPIDHFHNDSTYEPHSNEFFNLRYWFDASNYLPGGPVIVLQSGETSGEDRLPFLQKGILAKLSQATHGIGVVLEHRYYGTSFPTPDLSTKSLRFLTTDQALADEAYFARHVVFKGLEDKNLTAPNVAYISYGGSYAGAFSAFLRKLYPDVFWGAISSSGVTEAIYDYWQYYEPIREYGPPDCILTQQRLTHVVDSVLIGKKDDTKTIQQLKSVFGLENIISNQDFASVLTTGIDQWQDRVWDPASNDPGFDHYCANITSPTILYPATKGLASTVSSLIQLGGYKNKDLRALTTRMLNYIGHLNLTVISRGCAAASQDDCFAATAAAARSATAAAADDNDLTQTWRSWPYQVCTQWGFFATGSGLLPATALPLISRTLDLAYHQLLCSLAFPSLSPSPPNTSTINRHGGYAISYPRLAIVDGEQDPWRPATPHASPFVEGVGNRTSTESEPFLLIKGAVHHWDEYGLFENETAGEDMPPREVREAQELEVRWVRSWMGEWEKEKGEKAQKEGEERERGEEKEEEREREWEWEGELR